jgi:uncharacterized membrane protein
MDQYPIHRGVDKTVEFKGLTAQYVAYFVVGVLALMVIFVVMQVFGCPVFISLLIIGLLSLALIGCVFYANKKYGRYGLMKRRARSSCPRFLLSRMCFKTILRQYKNEV